MYIVCTPPPRFCWRGSSYQIFKEGGLTGPQFLEVGCWERVDELFRGGGGGGLQFLDKLEYLMTKKFIDKNVSFCHN